MEVSAACSILAGLGILESDTDRRKEKKSSKIDSSKEPVFSYAEVGPGLIQQIIDYLKEMWGTKIELNPLPLDSLEVSEQNTSKISTHNNLSVSEAGDVGVNNDGRETESIDFLNKCDALVKESITENTAYQAMNEPKNKKSVKCVDSSRDNLEVGSESEDDDGGVEESEDIYSFQKPLQGSEGCKDVTETADQQISMPTSTNSEEKDQEESKRKTLLSIDTSELNTEKDENMPKSAISARKSIGTIRGWKLKFRKDAEGKEPFAILNSGDKIKRWNEATYAHTSSLEQEEKLVRYIAGQCNTALPVHDFRIGTNYLNWEYSDTSPNAELEPVGLPTIIQAFSDNVSVDEEQQQLQQQLQPEVQVIAPHDLHNPNKHITAEFLLQKIAKTKRQRGAATLNVTNASNPGSTLQNPISIGIYNGGFVDTLRQLSSHTVGTYWDSNKLNSGNRKRSISSIDSSEYSSIIDYMQSLGFFTNITIGSIAATNFNKACLAGEYASVNTNILRKYVAPVLTINGQSSMPKIYNGSLVDSELNIPDLSIPTIEVPWETVVSEFHPIQTEEEIMSSLQHASGETAQHSQTSDLNQQDSSKKTTKNSSLKQNSKIETACAKPSTDVQAPQFFELAKPMVC